MLNRLSPRTRIAVLALAGLVLLGVVAAVAAPWRTAPAPARVGTETTEPDHEVAPEAAPETAVPTIRGPRIPPLDEALTRGAKDPAVLIVEFGDFQCPECREFTLKTEPALLRKYADTVRFAWRDFPARGEDSVRAAVAARAAARQGRFWEYHDALFAKGSGYTDAYLRDAAGRVGLDLARFDADRRDPALRKAVDKDFAFGRALGLPGTPGFLINGEPFFGAQPIKAFEKAIEKAKKSAG